MMRQDVEAPTESDDLLVSGFSFGSSGSVVDERVKLLNHSHPLFKTDNATACSKLDEATHGTIFAATIKPCAHRKDGRSAWLALVSSHAGEDEWEKLHKEKLAFLMNAKWNGKSYSL